MTMPDNLEDNDASVVEYLAIKNSLDNNMGTLTQLGTTAYQDMIDRIRKNRRGLGGAG
jgi:hypothetical protein